MRKILLASAFALFGTFAMANEVELKNDNSEITSLIDDCYYYEYEEPEYGDTIAALYQLNDEMSYLMMGRVDLGINYEGWTLQDTADYLTKNGMDGSAAQELYTTMVGDPAVYQSYSTGYYEMKEVLGL